MSSQLGKWREEQILVICPGSQTTMAQLGCGELTPPAHRLPTRMFKDDESDGWRPYRTYKRKKTTATAANATTGNRETTNGADAAAAGGAKTDDDEYEYVEDPDSEEGAVYPIQGEFSSLINISLLYDGANCSSPGGRIVNMPAFLAFLDHVHSMLTTSYHNTPIMLMAAPQWTRPDCEDIARYIFEKTKTPALCLIHSGIATQYGLKHPHMTVVDIGFEKVDVTCIYDSNIVSHKDVGAGFGPNREISGGEVFTRKLQKLLEGQGFDREMAEQLKKSSICEVLPYAADNEKLMELPVESGPAPVSATAGPGEGPKIVEPLVGGDDALNGEPAPVDEEGVLDVANIVASGQTREFLAKKEKEKAEKAKAGRKGKAQEAEAAAAKNLRLPNSKRTRNVFHLEEFVTEDVPVPATAPAEQPKENDVEMTDAAAANASAAAEGTEPKTEGEAPKPETGAEKPQEASSDTAAKPETMAAPAAETSSASAPEKEETTTSPTTERQTKRVRRDIEVGLERFQFADRVEIDRIVTAIYRAVQEIDDMYMRPPCWENLVFVGNGARIRGLRENILQTLQARHLISPSSATMFTSELPSNIGTPSGTGSQTPTGSFGGQIPAPSSVNPLLQAATTASLQVPGAGGAASNAGDAAAQGGPSHHFHSQTPTNIKLASLPTYLSEWTKNGFEEAMFLGAQVASRIAFCMHNTDAQTQEFQRLMSLSRVEYK